MAGNIKIIEPRENYQKVSKDIIFNETVDPLTLGIYVKVLCLGKKWELNVKGLASTLHVSADKVRASFSILEETGYLRRTRVQGTNGHFSGWDYEISSAPLTDITKTPTSVKTERRKTPTSEKCPAINRDNTVQIETQPVFIPPTPPEVADYVRKFGMADPDGFAIYYVEQMTNNGWTYGKKGTPVKNWKNNVQQWLKYHKNEDFSFLKPSSTHTQKPAPSALNPDTYHKIFE